VLSEDRGAIARLVAGIVVCEDRLAFGVGEYPLVQGVRLARCGWLKRTQTALRSGDM
jgi:hypothetical protein